MWDKLFKKIDDQREGFKWSSEFEVLTVICVYIAVGSFVLAVIASFISQEEYASLLSSIAGYSIGLYALNFFIVYIIYKWAGRKNYGSGKSNLKIELGKKAMLEMYGSDYDESKDFNDEIFARKLLEKKASYEAKEKAEFEKLLRSIKK